MLRMGFVEDVELILGILQNIVKDTGLWLHSACLAVLLLIDVCLY